MSYVVLNPSVMYEFDDLRKMFPLPCEIHRTTGIQVGTILRFRTFYLKLYSANALSSYEIQGYRYNENVPVFVDIVPVNKMREYASQFTKEDWLNSKRK